MAQETSSTSPGPFFFGGPRRSPFPRRCCVLPSSSFVVAVDQKKNNGKKTYLRPKRRCRRLGPFSEPSRRPLVPPRLVVVGTPVPLSRRLRRSTRDPPHEQLLVRLGAGGGSFVVGSCWAGVVAVAVAPSLPLPLSSLCRCRPCRCPAVVVPLLVLVLVIPSSFSSRWRLSSWSAPRFHPASSCSRRWWRGFRVVMSLQNR
jgi:hypothetical protein